jgi:uncharacterized membrane protein YgcG
MSLFVVAIVLVIVALVVIAVKSSPGAARKKSPANRTRTDSGYVPGVSDGLIIGSAALHGHSQDRNDSDAYSNHDSGSDSGDAGGGGDSGGGDGGGGGSD